MARLYILIAVISCAVLAVVANTRTCFCHWRICGSSGCKRGDVPNDRYHKSWPRHVTCSYAKRRCTVDCPNTVKRVLSNPQSTAYAGRKKACEAYGRRTSNRGIRLEAVRKASNCESDQYTEIVDYNSICCKRTCTQCRVIVRGRVGGSYVVKKLNIYVGQPYVPIHYYCSKPLTKLCERDCNVQIRRRYSLRYDYINYYSGNKICNAIRRKVPPPGVIAGVDYDIGDGHDHHYNLRNPKVCCGCTCRMSVVIGGVAKPVRINLSQSASKRFFRCRTHAADCKRYCRQVINKALTGQYGVFAKFNLLSASKACSAVAQTVTKPGMSVYSNYDFGNGNVHDKLGKVCCFQLPFPPKNWIGYCFKERPLISQWPFNVPVVGGQSVPNV